MYKSIFQMSEKRPFSELSKSTNLIKRKRATHRKPPKTSNDSTSPIGVLTSFEIPKLLLDNQQLLKEKFQILTPINLKQVENPMRDIVNDLAIKLAFNNRIIKNVKILELSSKGDGIAFIPCPTIEEIHEKQRETTELQLLEGMQKQGSQEIIDGLKQKIDRSKSIHRRTINKEILPLIQIVLIPFALPGDILTIKLNLTNQFYVDGEIISIQEKSKMRLNEEPKCSYFGICSGCQYQTISYDDQLKQKMNVIKGAFEFFCSNIKNHWDGKIQSTVGSPLQFRYRTKLTPHYDVPRSVSKKGFVDLNQIPRLGYSLKGKGEYLGLNFKRYNPNNDYTNEVNEFKYDEFPKLINNDQIELPDSHPINGRNIIRNRSIRAYPGDVIDIEDCLIGTDIVRRGFLNERNRLEKDWNNNKRSKKGVTILLREHSTTNDEEEVLIGSINPINEKITKIKESELIKTCVTNPQEVISDYVNTGLGSKLRFDFIANEFFQNNNSILPLIIKYVYDELFIDSKNKFLVDAYCGSGLFSISIASSEKLGVSKVLGVEISERAVKFAIKNAELNNIPKSKCDFICGKAEQLFESIDFPKDQTGVILDPPRKGCDSIFLNQLSEFEPNRIVYVSCNVHSQARDINFFLNETVNGSKYKIKSIKGFDFFPQTHHVESVAVLIKDQ